MLCVAGRLPGGLGERRSRRERQASSRAAACLAKPLGVQFVRSPGRPSGVLTWQQPVRLPVRPAGYRVYRNGKVVGQTRVSVRRLRVSFLPGAR